MEQKFLQALEQVRGQATALGVRIRPIETMEQAHRVLSRHKESDGFSHLARLGEVTKTPRGKLWMAGLFLTPAKKMRLGKPKSNSGEKKTKKQKNPEMNSGVMNMIVGFTILRFCGMLGVRNVTFTKEELLKMNAKLNKIRKPKS